MNTSSKKKLTTSPEATPKVTIINGRRTISLAEKIATAKEHYQSLRNPELLRSKR